MIMFDQLSQQISGVLIKTFPCFFLLLIFLYLFLVGIIFFWKLNIISRILVNAHKHPFKVGHHYPMLQVGY